MNRRKVQRINPIPGLVQGMARADANPSIAEVAALVGKVQATFEQFKTANDERVKALEKGREDIVTTEKVDKINAAVGDLDKELRTLTVKIEAARTAGNDDTAAMTPERKEYAKGFRSYIRKGTDGGLGEMSVKASLSTDSNPDGGYVVTPELDKAITRVVGKTLGMRTVAGVQNVGTSTLKAIHNLGGSTSGWVGERGSRPQTGTPQLAELSFPTMEQYAMPAATQTMLDDAWFDAEGWLADEVGIAFREQEGDAFFNGDGANKPRGIYQYPTVANASYAWGSVGFIGTGGAGFAGDPAGLDALIKLIYAAKPAYRANGKFLMNDATFSAARLLKDSQGHYQWQPSNQAGEPSLLLGYPLVSDDGMQDLGANKFPVGFGDWERFYWIVDRMGARVLRDPYSSKPYILFYTTRRVGGGIRDFAAVKFLKCA